MSWYNGFSEADLSELEVWEVPDVSGKKKPKVKKEEAAPVLTVSEIEVMQKQAYDEAFKAGKQKGYDAGYSEGHAIGVEAGEVEGITQGKLQGYEENKYLLQEQVVQFIPLLEALSHPLESLDEQVEKSLIHLVVLMAEHVIHKELQLDPKQIGLIIKESVKLLPVSQHKISLTLHPDDALLLKDAVILQESDFEWVVHENAELTRGGVVINTTTSHIDATIEKKLSEITESVLGVEFLNKG